MAYRQGKKPYEVENWGGAIISIKQAIGSQIKDKITNHPSYLDLQKKVFRQIDPATRQKHQNDYEFIVGYQSWNLKSKASEDISKMQFKILSDLNIRQMPDRSSYYRTGNQINWHKASIVIAKESGLPVPSNVLKKYNLK